MSRSGSRFAAVTLSVAALVLASSQAANASTAKPKHHPFKVHGIVTAVHGEKVTVLARTETVGRKIVARNKTVTLTFTPKTRQHATAHTLAPHLFRAACGCPAVIPGDQIDAVGDDTSGTLVTTSEESAPRPAEALIGTVESVDGSTIEVRTADACTGDSSEADGGETTTVDVSQASFVGPNTDAGDFTVGESIAILGENSDNDTLAAKVYSFTGTPSLVLGTVSAADEATHVLTVTPKDAEGDNSDSTDPAVVTDVTVDTATADIVINGNDENTATTATYPAVGDEILTIGAPGATANSLTATLVFAFDHHDTAPVGDNQD